jgi:ribosomal protein S4
MNDVTLIEYLRPFHGGQSAARRLVDSEAVSVNGSIIRSPDFLVLDGDLIRVGKSWRRVVGAE